MKPERFYNSDARFNIGCALGAISVLKKGIFVSMNGVVREWNQVERCYKTGLFVPIG